jgi:ABC-type multidrug transport system ATPase subunit
MGYCPQVDVIIPNLTVLETVEFYARIKGVPENYL